MDEKWDKIVTITFWMNLIMPFSILLPYEWLKAFLYLDPSYVTYEDPTIDWAVATFAFIGLLLALFVPKVSEFDRQLTKEMGVTDPEIKPSTWRCVLFRLYGEYPSWMQWVFDFFLSSQSYFIILCVLGGVFIFCPILRGVLILGTLIYSYCILISMESLSNIEQYETLLLDNIKEPEVFELLKKYVKKVYSTQGHPRQEAFLEKVYENRYMNVHIKEYHPLLDIIYATLQWKRIDLNEVFCEKISYYSVLPFGNVSSPRLGQVFNSKSILEQWERSFTSSLRLLKHNPHLANYLVDALIPPENLLGALNSIDLSGTDDTLHIPYELLQKWPFSLSSDTWHGVQNESDLEDKEYTLHSILEKGMCLTYLSQLLLVLVKINHKEALKRLFCRLEVLSKEFNQLHFSEELFVFVFLALGGTNSYACWERDIVSTFEESEVSWSRGKGRDFLLLFIFKNWILHQNWNSIVNDYVLPILEHYPNIRSLFIIEKHNHYIRTYFEFIQKGNNTIRHQTFLNEIFSEVFGFTDLEKLYEQQNLFHDEMRKRFIEKGWSHA
jgi:F0F1-type ATP synthase delta subunit